MPLSNSVLRRYTPPTCTLEIAAKTSPLSRWVGKSMMKDLRFELRFDDPRQSEETRVTIRGNAGDLEMLGDVVNSYVQDFLNSSSMELSLTPGTSTNGNVTPSNPPNGSAHISPVVNAFAPKIPQSSGEPGFDNASSVGYPQSDPKVRSFQPRTPTEIYLQPKGLLSHELFLGGLATAESGLAVDLSVLQLFDLATALDEYATEVVALPKLNNPLPWKKAPPAWTSAAAMVLLAVGVTGGITFFNQQNKPQTTASKAGQPSPSLTPLSPLLVPVAPVVSPLPTPVVPPALAASPRLTPPPAVSIPAPGTVTVPPLVNPIPGNSVNSSPATIALVPRRSTITSSSSSSSGIPSLAAPSVPPKNAANSAAGTTPTQPPLPSAPTAPPALNLPKLTPTPTSGTVTAQDTPTAGVREGASADLNPAESTPATPAANSRLSDVIPQVAEVRSYLQKRWNPPSGLTQTLEYYLVLNGDGSIQRIIPLGQAAGKYIDVTSMPLPGEPFVSGISGGRNPKIRVVFTPDGKVDSFLDQAN
jgi:hypothetical protein